MTNEQFRCVLDCRCRLGESPVWSWAERALWFVDIKGRRLHRFDPVLAAHADFALDEETGCIGLADNGGFVAGTRSGLWRLDRGGRRIEQLAENPEDQDESRFNDGCVDPGGRYLVGTLDEAKRDARAHLYRYDRRGLAVLAGGLTTSNGLAFSPDGRTLYHADTPQFVVWRYDYDSATGEAENRREFARLDADASDRARPDGAAVDADGCYWTALFGGGRLHRYDPDGTLMGAHPLQAQRPTMPAFGGPDLKTLYVTTARDGAADGELERLPFSGGLFAMHVQTPGLKARLFKP